jgi:uncharacterized YccA/Bax inhibitor family protein
MRTSNPTLRSDTFTSAALTSSAAPMTLRGTVNKCFILFSLTVASASLTWFKASTIGMPVAIGAGLLGTLICLILCFKQVWAPALAPAYAVLEGLFLGAISAHYNRLYDGIVGQAVMLTLGVFFALLAAYQSGLIKPSQNFRLGIVAATGGIFIVYLATMVLGMFGIQMPFIHDSGPIGIGISVAIVVIAALNLVLDFDFIEGGVEVGAPKYMEWYAAFGLLVTLVWLYLEILRLLAKLRNR